MAREGLRQELALILPKVLRNKGTLIQPGIRVDTPNGIQTVNLTVHAIEQPETLRGMTMIMFSDVEASEPEPAASGKRPSARGRLGTQERFLQQAFDEVQRLQEQVQTQQEELRSANEALQSILEELQCTHEELTATKGEMQSLDEELQTVNIELQHKVYDLLTLKSDMNNLLDSTGIATVFLDNALKVRRFTPQATKIFKLFPGDVGRSLSDIVTDLNYPALQADQWEVLRTLSHSEKQIVTHDGRWFKVKIMPFCTPDNVIDGVVIILNDISIAKSLEA
jgi:two-component system CheB/CheR fusion protein